MKITYKVDWKPLEKLSKIYSDKIDLSDWMYMGTVEGISPTIEIEGDCSCGGYDVVIDSLWDVVESLEKVTS